jgi:hypothetical protein
VNRDRKFGESFVPLHSATPTAAEYYGFWSSDRDQDQYLLIYQVMMAIEFALKLYSKMFVSSSCLNYYLLFLKLLILSTGRE